MSIKVIITEEKESDYFESENMVKKAFWNLHVPGCNEHYLVHKLRTNEDYIPELTRVAKYNGKIVGAIYYSKSIISNEEKSKPVITFGPLCVDPNYQNLGIGKLLLKTTMNLAKSLGYEAIIIFGEPDYYPKHGFVPCIQYGITTSEGKNFDAFMCIELVEGALMDVNGKFYEATVFNDLPEEKVEMYDQQFPYMEKKVLPSQWNQEEVNKYNG